jgi:hypothetical protein
MPALSIIWKNKTDIKEKFQETRDLTFLFPNGIVQCRLDI